MYNALVAASNENPDLDLGATLDHLKDKYTVVLAENSKYLAMDHSRPVS